MKTKSTKKWQQLCAASKREYLRWEYWREQTLIRPYGSVAYQRAVAAEERAWHRSVDAGNRLAAYERNRA